MMHKSITNNMFAMCLLIPISAMIACGGDSPEFDDPVAAGTVFISAACGKFHECRSEAPAEVEVTFEFFFGPDVETCKTNLAQTAEQEEALRAAVDEGRATYYPDRADACVDAIEATTCAELWSDGDQGSECGSIYEGTIAGGEACAHSAECVSQECSSDTNICEPDSDVSQRKYQWNGITTMGFPAR